MAVLSERFEEALRFAASVHRTQIRKGTTIPYITHLLAVCVTAGEQGGDEDQMIAALLHDSMEDQGVTREEISKRFGDHVAAMVEACSDSTTQPKPPWRERKERYIQHLKVATPEVRLISLADKLHNARSILNDLRKAGPETWKRFTAGPAEILWYYREVIAALRSGWDHPLVDELERTVQAIAELGKLEEREQPR